ncbi:chemotaxis protein MotB [Loktanella sp. IMCC34160]|uniref:flagellar motor protein MotB n=1 Tax=Loktanella sp. IMCC34160 TaxID=2510646 RepID=UPI00101CDC0A|nr:flagellar motor protein MotB [Loktanella sp. IMCC34160]RYG91450.1 chemotaxis protein MotB [Loktanella sp. IMCC34160]
MGAAGANAPIIIKRKKVIAGGGHHGGAWKVAYADFVTAMMAFFMLMWLLNATTEQQRKGIADYFSPTLPVNRISGGGDGMFGGDNILSEQTLAQNGTGASHLVAGDEAVTNQSAEAEASAAAAAAMVAVLEEVETVLLGRGGESALPEEALRHIVTRLTDEGLVIEIFDVDGVSLFEGDTAVPSTVMTEVAVVLGRVFAMVENPVAFEGHTAARPIVVLDSPVWDLSTDRAMVVRKLIQGAGVAPSRIARVTGHADRDLASANPMSVRNNRIEVTLLRSDQ